MAATLRQCLLPEEMPLVNAAACLLHPQTASTRLVLFPPSLVCAAQLFDSLGHSLAENSKGNIGLSGMSVE